MSGIAMALMWAAILLAPIKVTELLEPLKRYLVPDGDATSLRLEAIIMAITLIITMLLSVLLMDIIGPPGPPPDWASGPAVPTA